MGSPRNVLITGASGALGAAVVAAFHAQGDRVMGASHPEFDLSQAADAARAVAAVDGGLHTLVHLVGGFAGGQPVATTDDATWRKMMTMNLDAAFYMARAAVPVLTRQPGGRVVMIGARAAVLPGPNLAAYNASKAGLVALVKTLALEIADLDATANIILPSVIDTAANRAAMPQADPKRWVSPQSIADLVCWLASAHAASVNGAAVPIYGQS